MWGPISMSMKPRGYLVLFFVISAIITISMLIVPFLSPYGSIIHLDGRPGLIDHADLWSDKDPLSAVLYTFGDLACHQQMSRTLIINGSEMPICIRDLGLLMGFMMGCLITAIIFGHPMIYNSARLYVIISFSLIFTDWMIQHIFDLNIPVTRMVTGLLAGAGFSLILYCWIFTIYYGRSRKEKV